MTTQYSKHASLASFFTHPLTTALAPVALSAGALGAHHLMDARRKSTSYKEMLNLHPRLGKQRDQTQVRRIFNSLHNVNPTLAKDPLVAGAWIDNVIESNKTFGEGSSNQALLMAVKDLAQIRSHISQAREKELKPHPLTERLQGAIGSGLHGMREMQEKAERDEMGQLQGALAAAQEKREKFQRRARGYEAIAMGTTQGVGTSPEARKQYRKQIRQAAYEAGRRKKTSGALLAAVRR